MFRHPLQHLEVSFKRLKSAHFKGIFEQYFKND